MRKIIILALIASLPYHGFSQDTLKNTGNLQLHPGASVSSFGVFFSETGSHLINNGNLYLRNNLVNEEASMSAGTGGLILCGTVLQLLEGTQPFNTYQLTTNNAAGIQLNNNLSIAGSHTFTSGMISTSATPNFIIYESGATYTGDNDARHVNGWVRKNGADDFNFPVGDGLFERKIAVSSLSVSGSFTCHYYKPTFNIYNLMSPLVQVKENEYWQLNKISGGTARITLNWDHNKVPMNHVLISDILAGYYSGSNWTSIGGTASGNVLTTGQVTSSPVANFGYHTLGYTNFPLPVTLTAFTGRRERSTSFLNWSAENESGILFYSVERSFDGVNFEYVGKVLAINNGQFTKYTYQDPVNINGRVFYRLRIINRDSKVSYSGVVILSETAFGENLKVVNPVNGQIMLQSDTYAARSDYKYRILTLAGQVIQAGAFSINASGAAYIPLKAGYAKGLYHLELTQSGKTSIKKLIFE